MEGCYVHVGGGAYPRARFPQAKPRTTRSGICLAPIMGSYARWRAAHSHMPTGSRLIMTFVPSMSVRQKSLNTWIHTPWLNVFLGEPSAS